MVPGPTLFVCVDLFRWPPIRVFELRLQPSAKASVIDSFDGYSAHYSRVVLSTTLEFSFDGYSSHYRAKQGSVTTGPIRPTRFQSLRPAGR